jgi:hypothetical protein
MSTSITNAYILNTSNSKKVNKVNERLRAIFKKLIYVEIVHKIVDIVTPIANYKENEKSDYLNHQNNCLDYLQDNHYELKNDIFTAIVRKAIYPTSTLFDFAKKSIELIDTYQINSNLFKGNNHIYFKTIGNVTLYYFNVSNKSIKEFDFINKTLNILKSYDYYDNTDRPEDVTEKAWNHRRHIWDRVLGESDQLRDVMYSIDLNIDYYNIKETDIIKHCPDANSRLIAIYKRSRINELVKQLKNERMRIDGMTDEDQLSSHDYVNFYYDASEQVSEEIINSVYASSQRHIDMLDTQEDFLKKVFYDKYTSYQVKD